jgi:hypothetical protein
MAGFSVSVGFSNKLASTSRTEPMRSTTRFTGPSLVRTTVIIGLAVASLTARFNRDFRSMVVRICPRRLMIPGSVAGAKGTGVISSLLYEVLDQVIHTGTHL